MTDLESVGSTAPGGNVPFRALGDLGVFIRGNGLQKSDLTESGFPAIHYGQLHTHYGVWASTTKSFTTPEFAARLRRARPGDLLIATTSEDDASVGKATAWLGDTEVAVSGDAYIYRHELDPRFVAYFFQSEQFRSQKSPYLSGTKVRRISGDSLAKIKMPVPSIARQVEVVRTLDMLRDLEAELKAKLEAELQARRTQYVQYRKQLLPSKVVAGVTASTLGGVSVSVTSGGTPPTGNAEYYGGDIPWLRTQEVNFGLIRSTSVTITEAGLRNSSAKWIPKNCVIVAMYGATAAKVAVNDIPLTTNQACCNLQIDPSIADFRYVFHWVSNEYERLRALGEGSQSNINAQKVKDYPILLPPLSKQAEIVETLDKFDTLIDDLSTGLTAELAARRKQYEYYRDKLLTFEEAPA